MKLWEKKYLTVVFLPYGDSFNVSGDVYTILQERLNKLELKPVTKKLKNKLKSKQYIAFNIMKVGYPDNAKGVYVSEPDFKQSSDAVVFVLALPFIEYTEKDYMGLFLYYLGRAVIEGLDKLDIDYRYVDSVFNNR